VLGQFPQRCGGIYDFPELYCGDDAMTDSLAILQTTCIVAAFTIFVFGGLSTEVAIRCGVTQPRGASSRQEEGGAEPEGLPSPAAFAFVEGGAVASCLAALERGLAPQAWGFSAVEASGPRGQPDSAAEDDEGNLDESSRRSESAASKGPGPPPLRPPAPPHQIQPSRGSVQRRLAAAAVTLALLAFGASRGREAICGAPDVTLPTQANILVESQRSAGSPMSDGRAREAHEREGQHHGNHTHTHASAREPHEAHRDRSGAL
jgi:hypothetical protein